VNIILHLLIEHSGLLQLQFEQQAKEIGKIEKERKMKTRRKQWLNCIG
jgi:hypothetical protein